MSDKKPLNIGMIGYGFMGRAHSNAYQTVGHFFDSEYQPVLKAACARSTDSVQAFADNWGYESIETDWRKLIARDDIDAVDICVPNNLHKEMAIACGRSGQDDPVRKALGDECGRRRRNVPGGRKSGRRQHGLVQLPPRAGGHVGEAVDRRRTAWGASITTGPTSCRTGRSPKTCPRVERRCGDWMPKRQEAA